MESVVEEAKKRWSEGDAPTLETKGEYLKMIRAEKRHEEERYGGVEAESD